MSIEAISIESVGKRGPRKTYQAKIGTMSGSVIIVKSVRKFHVDQRIEFAELSDLEGCSIGVAPRWRPGYVWKIEDDRLFINLR